MNDAIHCRFCNATLEHTFADLGQTPLANAYLSEADLALPEPWYPLHARVCSECFLVQLPEVVSPEEIFSDYAYYSSYSDSWLDHSHRFAAAAIERFDLDTTSRVIEVASNDGYLLRYFRERGIAVLGIEPAKNVAADANAAGIPTEAEFFGRGLAADLVARGIRPDLLVGNNVLAHVPDINDFVAGLAMLLLPTGTLVMEFPHLLNLIEQGQYDTIYHEHFSYLSLLAVERIFAAHGLTLVDVEQIPTHGGSLRVFACAADGPAVTAASPQLVALLRRESQAGLENISTYARFAATVEESKRSLRAFLKRARAEGKSVAAYGAAAKGNTLLNSIGASTDLVEYVVDRSPHKQGRYLPGSHLPIFDPSRILETRPDYVLILPWNLTDEIVAQMAEVRAWGGRFVVAVPQTHLVT